ncbi:uncharacterized protein FOMMEDRAFT_134904 [Fomitiporia mediterranea MF3/22]|uniref:uncharacterized protein n=1 Tax=Fomitiporia mediterranea (strain MF3/22) TaxID=694068 RepID=UPI0004408A2D|nr:uncharacterized protein FOMMEDRAFT_134904 [Fomitiporia mediterranea MF3/22]EJD02359.1 hypothetical protein FOMMEDRAFT_134904 [Fomitiporia mediterranea MF3/22]
MVSRLLSVVESHFNTSPGERHRLFRRKGGGGRGGGGGGGKGGKGSSKGGSKGGSSAAKSHGASDKFTKSRGAKSVTIPATSSSAYAYSDGGGKRIVLGSNSPFHGRQAGGGARTTIYGTSRFGSGYPYGGYGYYVEWRPLPYYFYPVPVAPHYYGGDEYLNVTDTQRPGGNLATAVIQLSSNTTSVTYRLAGDNSSVVAVFDALVANCSVVNSTSAITRFEPSNTTWPVPEQVIQYYRASSFLLSLDGYNNTASLPSNAPSSNTSAPAQIADTPLPSGLNQTFLQCVNSTIAASVPLVDISKKKLSTAAITGIVLGSVLGFIVLLCFGSWCIGKRRSRKEEKRKRKEEKKMEKAMAMTLERSEYETLEAPAISVEKDGSHPSPAFQSETGKDPSWLSRLPFIGDRNGYRSVHHRSTSSVELPLTTQHDVEKGSEHARSRSPSPAHSRSPSPSLYDTALPLRHAEDERRPF